MAKSGARGGAGTNVAIISLLVAVVSLAVSVLIIYNGSSKQDQFESNRQLCVDGLSEFGRTMLEIKLGQGDPTPSQLADFIIDGARARVGCFDTQVLDDQSAFFEDWLVAEQVIGLPLAIRGDTTYPSGTGKEIRDRSLEQLISAADDALVAAINAPGPGVWPWEGSGPTAPPTFPSG